MKKVSKAALIRVELAEGVSVKDIAKKLKLKEAYVAQVKWHWNKLPHYEKEEAIKKSKKKPSKLLKAVDDANKMFEVDPPAKVWLEEYTKEKALKIDSVNFGEPSEAAKTWLEEYTKKVNALLDEQIELKVETIDPVNSPAHYTAGGIETIDFIEAKQLNYHLGNCVKYLSRAGLKTEDTLEDLKKAAWYLNREIENLEFKVAEKEWAENT